jgi:translocation and assembly module TamB
MDTAKKIRKISCLIVLGLLLGIAVMVLRGPHISNSLKRTILPELEMATGHKVIAQKIYINLFPLFVEAKELKMFDEDGNRILLAKRVKAYLDISGIFDKSIKIRRLVIKEPVVTADRQKTKEIIDNIKTYLSQKKKKKINVQVMSVEVQHGKAAYTDIDIKTTLSLYGFDGEIIIGKVPKIKGTALKILIKRDGWPEIAAEISTVLQLKDGILQINKLQVNSFDSQLTGSGEYVEDGLVLKGNFKLLVKTVKEMFHLRSSGEGELDAKGNITFKDNEIMVDLKLSGEFYLQTLMELLKVKDKIQGLVKVQGEIKGGLSNIKGAGIATLHRGNLYDVDIDFLKANVSYANGVMSFTDGQGKLYNGLAKASASIALPVVNTFTLAVDFANADSLPLFKLIGWDPGIQRGKVTGTLYSTGHEFNPTGSFKYKSASRGNDILGRISDIEGSYSKNGQILSLNNIKLGTDKSNVFARGNVDLEKKSLDINCSLQSGAVTDITLPYYNKLEGKGEFAGKVTGSFDDPVISGRLKMPDAIIEGYRSGKLDADVVYRKNLLHINEFILGQGDELHSIGGDIYFNNAKKIFDLSRAEYKLHAVLKHADIEKFVKIFYPDFKASGRFSSDLNIRGTAAKPDIKGTALLGKGSLYDVPFDSASFNLHYADKNLELSNARGKKGKSILQGDFTLYPDATFSYKAYSDNVMLSDIIPIPIQGEATLSVKTEGKGTIDNPTIFADAKFKDGVLKGKHIGSGVMTVSIRDKNIALKARMINEKLSVEAKGRLEGELPWEAKVDIQTGRYDFLVTSFLKDVPEDLILSLNGSVTMRGTRKHIAASSKIKRLVLSMYGYSFSNEEEMNVELNDRKLSFSTFSLRSGNTLLRVGGGMEIGRAYNLSFEGSSALSPFKSLSSKLGLLKGNAEFVVEVTGAWETPKINGGITLVNGSVGLKKYPAHRVTNLNGYLYMDNDRVVLQSLSGKIGGGDLDFSGILYLKRFAFSRFYVEAKMKNVTTSISNEFSVNFDGSLLYKGTPEAQVISGNIDINRARYRERVEWKSWLLQAKKAEILKTDISGLEKADLNIKITGKDNIIIDNNVARAVVGADMVLRGKLYRPSLLGRFETSEGKVFFRNNEFNILHASADFSDPNRLNPFISIAAETVVKGYKVKMNLEGQLDHFNMSLSSDPPLKEMDVLALLTVGQIGTGVKGLEAGIGAGEATSFVTGKMQDVLEERLRSITGLDRFQVDPYVSKTTGTVEPRVTVSKRLMGEKVFVTYTTGVGALEEQIIKLEFFMTKNVSLVGVRDERGITGGDIRFRFEFK